jgi:hypothetical protein
MEDTSLTELDVTLPLYTSRQQGGLDVNWQPILAALLLLSPHAARADFFVCNATYRGATALGWCEQGSFTGFLHLGTLAWARTDGDVTALAQAALVTEAEGSVRAGQLGLLNRTGVNLTGLQLGLSNTVLGQTTGLQVGLGNSTSLIAGMQLSAFHNQVHSGYGLQLGSIHNAAGTLVGVQAHLGALYGWPILVSRLTRYGDLQPRRDVYVWAGLFLSGVNSARTLHGAQIGGWMNHAGELHGLQVGAVNWLSPGETSGTGEGIGVQLGLVNRARTWSGLQVGLVNSATRLRGLQLGLVNHAGNAWLPVTPVLNAAWESP